MLKRQRINWGHLGACGLTLTCIVISGGCKRPAVNDAGEGPAGTIAPSTTAANTPSTAVPPKAVGTPAPKPATTAPAMVDYQDKGTHFQYSRNWTAQSDQNFTLHLVPAVAHTNCQILFDIPDLPPHFPGMIRLGLIENGYVSDLKEKHPGLHVDKSTDYAMKQNAKARLVETSWKQGNITCMDVGVLIMRDDRVYTFSCDAEAKDLPATRSDFEQIIASVHWDK